MIAVAVSGGVDSLAALLMLREAGHKIMAVHALFTQNATVPAGLAAVCKNLAVPLQVVDLRQKFTAMVIEPFLASHKAGLTPNPCCICNKNIKFGILGQTARNLGCNQLATGHYARLQASPGQQPILLQGLDQRKDQSYFLSLVPAPDLNNTLFPLGELTKAGVRDHVASRGFKAPISAESQDICFLAQEGIDQFLAKHLNPTAGPVFLQTDEDEARQVGKHRGLCHYTIGQRRGLGIAWREPLYVRQRDFASNVLTVAPRQLAQMTACVVGSLNFLREYSEWPSEILVKLRYNQIPCAARTKLTAGEIRVALALPMLATAPGQTAAFYDKTGQVLAGGIVSKIEF